MTILVVLAVQVAIMLVAIHLARKQGKNVVVWAVGCWIFPPAVLFLRERKKPYHPETGLFKLKGFEMDTKTGEFTINGHHYHKSVVRSVKADYDRRNIGYKITVAVNDMQNPVHTIDFHTIFADFDAHFERLKMLLDC